MQSTKSKEEYNIIRYKSIISIDFEKGQIVIYDENDKRVTLRVTIEGDKIYYKDVVSFTPALCILHNHMEGILRGEGEENI